MPSYGNEKTHRIELMNDWTIMITNYLMLLFTDLVDNPVTRYNIGSGKSGPRGPKWAHGHKGTRADGNMGTWAPKVGHMFPYSHQLSMGAKAREPIWADKDDVEDAVGEDLGEGEENSEQSLDGPCGGVPESENGGGGEARAGKGSAERAGKAGGGGPEHGRDGARRTCLAGGRNAREGPGTARTDTSDEAWAANEAVRDTKVGFSWDRRDHKLNDIFNIYINQFIPTLCVPQVELFLYVLFNAR
jgi:hypothetical protein